MLRSCSVTQLFQGSCFRPVEYRSAGKSLRHVGEDDKCGDMLLPLPGSFTEDSHDATELCRRLQRAEEFVRERSPAHSHARSPSALNCELPPHPHTTCGPRDIKSLQEELQKLHTQASAAAQAQDSVNTEGEARLVVTSFTGSGTISATQNTVQTQHVAMTLCTAVEMLEEEVQRNRELQSELDNVRSQLAACERKLEAADDQEASFKDILQQRVQDVSPPVSAALQPIPLDLPHTPRAFNGSTAAAASSVAAEIVPVDTHCTPHGFEVVNTPWATPQSLSEPVRVVSPPNSRSQEPLLKPERHIVSTLPWQQPEDTESSATDLCNTATINSTMKLKLDTVESSQRAAEYSAEASEIEPELPCSSTQKDLHNHQHQRQQQPRQPQRSGEQELPPPCSPVKCYVPEEHTPTAAPQASTAPIARKATSSSLKRNRASMHQKPLRSWKTAPLLAGLRPGDKICATKDKKVELVIPANVTSETSSADRKAANKAAHALAVAIAAANVPGTSPKPRPAVQLPVASPEVAAAAEAAAALLGTQSDSLRVLGSSMMHSTRSTECRDDSEKGVPSPQKPQPASVSQEPQVPFFGYSELSPESGMRAAQLQI